MTPDDSDLPASFLAQFLVRQGALAEIDHRAVVTGVLPPELQQTLKLPESVSLRPLGSAACDEIPFALESAGMQWCLDTATGRGRLAAGALPRVRPKASGVAESVLSQFTALNASVRAASTRTVDLTPIVFEIGYDAVAEERTEGSVFVAVEPVIGAVSVPLAEALLARIADVEPIGLPLDPAGLSGPAGRLVPLARALILDRLAGFREKVAFRLNQDAGRLSEYHATLLHEARRRRTARSDGGSGSDSKIAAILRQRDEKLAELVVRHRVGARCRVASALVVRYSASVCDILVRRRQREIRIPIALDPITRGALPLQCPACWHPTLTVHICDDAGHVTCSSCAAPCGACARVTCRICHPRGCRKCAKAPSVD